MTKVVKRGIRSPWIIREFRHHKISFLILTIVLAYILFSNSSTVFWINSLGKFSYFGAFISGILISFGFLAPFAVGFFITLDSSNFILYGLLGGLGALFSDLLIFRIVKKYFMRDFHKIERTNFIKEVHQMINKKISHKFRNYILYVFAGILIATPLPDELGVIMLAGLTKIRERMLALIAFVLHSIGISLIILIS